MNFVELFTTLESLSRDGWGYTIYCYRPDQTHIPYKYFCELDHKYKEGDFTRHWCPYGEGKTVEEAIQNAIDCMKRGNK